MPAEAHQWSLTVIGGQPVSTVALTAVTRQPALQTSVRRPVGATLLDADINGHRCVIIGFVGCRWVSVVIADELIVEVTCLSAVRVAADVGSVCK